MASIVWRDRQKKWYAFFRDQDGVKHGKPLPESIPRKRKLSKEERLKAEQYAENLEKDSRAMDSSVVDLETAVAYWLDDVRVTNSIRTWERYRTAGKQLVEFISPDGKRIPLNLVTAQHMIQFRDYRLAMHRSARTVRNDLKTLSTLFTWANERGWIKENPVSKVRHPKIVANQKRLPTHGEIDQMLALLYAQDDKVLLAMGLMGAYAGMRRGDILRLEVSHLDLENRMIYVFHGKSKYPRPIPMHEKIRDFFMDYPLEGSHVFPQYHYANPFPAKKFNAFLAKNGFGWTHHSLRHFFNDQLRRTGLSEAARLLIVGHCDDRTNLIYSHPDAEEARPFVNALGLPPNNPKPVLDSAPKPPKSQTL